MAGPTVWTADRIATLKRLWAEGLSANWIAAELGAGITRNAVIGKADRLGLSGRPHGPKPRPREPGAPAARRGPRLATTFTDTFGASRPAPAPAPARAPDFAANPVAIADLERHHCRWPVGDPASAEFRFCGGDRHGDGPYCAGHHRLAYRRPETVDRADVERRRRAFREAA